MNSWWTAKTSVLFRPGSGSEEESRLEQGFKPLTDQETVKVVTSLPLCSILLEIVQLDPNAKVFSYQAHHVADMSAVALAKEEGLRLWLPVRNRMDSGSSIP